MTIRAMIRLVGVLVITPMILPFLCIGWVFDASWDWGEGARHIWNWITEDCSW